VVTTKAVYNGATGVVVDGAMRDVPELSRLPIQAYMRRGQPQTVSPIMMSVDYQVPVRIAGVTVRPGDILLGDRHGVLVIPVGIVDKAVDRALEKDALENFQRSLILQGESLYDVYPANEKVRQRYEEYRKKR
jgi:regulator of RNase E activity RraA